MAIFKSKIIIFQGQFSILSAFSIETFERSWIDIAIRSTLDLMYTTARRVGHLRNTCSILRESNEERIRRREVIRKRPVNEVMAVSARHTFVWWRIC